MTELAAQQRALAAAIVPGESPGALLRAAPDGRPARLFVYQQAYGARLGEALRSNHPILALVLGDDAFRELALGYLHEHPSRRPSIRWFGDRLAPWLRQRPALCPHPSLPDLAAMEWALRDAFDAADARPLCVAELLAVPAGDWPALRFAAHPSLALLALDWAVEPLWKALTADAEAATDAPEPLAHELLVWRQGLETRWRALEPDEAALLHACIEGRPFADLGTLAEAQGGEATAPRLAGLLRRWVDAGLLCAHGA